MLGIVRKWSDSELKEMTFLPESEYARGCIEGPSNSYIYTLLFEVV